MEIECLGGLGREKRRKASLEERAWRTAGGCSANGSNTGETASGRKTEWRHSILHHGDNIAWRHFKSSVIGGATVSWPPSSQLPSFSHLPVFYILPIALSASISRSNLRLPRTISSSSYHIRPPFSSVSSIPNVLRLPNRWPGQLSGMNLENTSIRRVYGGWINFRAQNVSRVLSIYFSCFFFSDFILCSYFSVLSASYLALSLACFVLFTLLVFVLTLVFNVLFFIVILHRAFVPLHYVCVCFYVPSSTSYS